MSDVGEKTCPLCAEEMDLTDQQLKPCKCGYEICVWCWHHIMDMAEKDETEGRCPACRAAYDKEKIVRTAANCERLVAEVNLERKMKLQKSKTKSSEGRKQLSSVRVIQRNLVYIVGLPLNLSDEDLLRGQEYFGQYGKVLKVSLSRTAAGAIQQFLNNTCSVYITYSKEEEAIRCIQSVHVFVLDGRPLKACFGTTKYCHAWLRNMPCNNPDCLYLHEIGSQEDSFTKDEIISAYSRVQQITGTTNNMQRRAGTTLPPPVDDYFPNSSTAKTISKSAPNNTISSCQKDSPSNGSPSRSIAFPAGTSWGTRALNQPQSTSLSCSNEPSKQESDTISRTSPFLSAVMNTNRDCTLHDDVVKKPSEEILAMHMKGKTDLLKPLKHYDGSDDQTATLEKPTSPEGVSASKSLSSQIYCPPASHYNNQGTNTPSTVTSSIFGYSEKSFIKSNEKAGSIASTDETIQSLYSDVSSLTLDRNASSGHSNVVRPSSSASDHGSSNSSGGQGLQLCYTENYREPLNSAAAGRSVTSPNRVSVSKEQYDWGTDAQTRAVVNTSSEVEDILSFDNQRLKDPEVISRPNYMPNSPISLHLSNHSRSHSFQYGDSFGAVNLNADTAFVDNKVSDSLQFHGSGVSSLLNEKYTNSIGSGITTGGYLLPSNQGKVEQMGRFLGNAENVSAKDETVENSIISNILSLDFDTWDESLSSPHNLAKMLGDNDKQQSNSLKFSTSRKALNNNQSRFSFARQDDSEYHPLDVESSFSVFGRKPQNQLSSQDFDESRDLYMNKFEISNGLSPSNFDAYNNFSANPSIFSYYKLSVSRAQMSAPPGFSIPCRAPPPGFSYNNERVDQSFDTTGNHLVSSSLLRNSYQAPASGGIDGAVDIEFMDPAILAVGKGRFQGGLNNSGLDMRSNFRPQLGLNENEARFQLLMQRSVSPHQNLRYDVGDNFSSLNDFYGVSSRPTDQSQVNNISPFAQLSLQQSRNSQMSNGSWDGGNEVQGGNNVSMAELLRNERLGFNKFYSGYEDSKYSMGDLYNRTLGM